MTRPDRIARMLQLDPSETGSGYSPDATARQVQDFDSLPQYIAARQAERDAMIARYNRWLRTWGRWALIAALAALLILLASHVAPIAAAHYAAPLMNNPY